MKKIVVERIVKIALGIALLALGLSLMNVRDNVTVLMGFTCVVASVGIIATTVYSAVKETIDQ